MFVPSLSWQNDPFRYAEQNKYRCLTVAFHPAGHRRLLRKARGVDLIPPEEQERIRENLPHLPKKRSEECVRRIRSRVEYLAEQPRLGALRKTRVFFQRLPMFVQSLSWSIDRV